MNDVYEAPVYYELAFSFRDAEHEIAVLEEIGTRFVEGSVRNVLEISCGAAPHLSAIARRPWRYTGLDLSEPMLAYGRRKAEDLGAGAQFVNGDLTAFTLAQPVDLAFVLLGSLYVDSQAGLDAHLDCMARAVRPGGVYVLDSCIDFAPAMDLWETWTEEDGEITVDVNYATRVVDRVSQVYEETLRLDVMDAGRSTVCETVALKRAIYPQEFLLQLRNHPEFEFVGWWNGWNLEDPLVDQGEVSRPLTVLRRVR